MKTQMLLSIAAGALALIVASDSSGCRRQAKWQVEATVTEAREPAPIAVDPPTRTFVSVPAGASATYPAGWEPARSPSFALMLVPVKAPPAQSSPAASSQVRWGEHFISLDIPKLPAIRIPGFLPMNRIRGGYIDDLRKQATQVNVEVLESPPIPGANASLVRATWPGERPTHVERALLLTHADRVYIVRGRSRAEDEPATRAAFDQFVKSINWSEQ